MFEAITRIQTISDELKRPMSEVALAWPLHKPGIASALVGARDAAQVEANVRCLDISLSAQQLTALETATDPVKQHLGLNLDPYESTVNSRIA
mmetsp:Transcript_6777/g.14992  ORF Transcript_6777/g.14992 Transcript_6777/m.14992 type:complete len:93 (+) Transcript_6777:50-328(+)